LNFELYDMNYEFL